MEFADLFRAHTAPGNDTRAWGSYGTVAREAGDQKSVIFTKEHGPLVRVVLHPSNVEVMCRVGGFIAGTGESSYFPFLEGDEVYVEIPQGDENSGCIITTRLNNEIDTWPEMIAGQDATKNNFGFWRLRTPFIIETAASFLIRAASTGAFFGIDPAGAVTLSNSDGSYLALTGDLLGISNSDVDVLMQIDVSAKQVVLEAKGTKFVLDGSSSTFNTSGTLDLATSGALANGHAVTLEQVILLLVNFLHFIGGPTGLSSKLTSDFVGPGKIFDPTDPSLSMLLTKMVAWLPLAAAPSPVTNVSPGGSLVGTFGLGLIASIQTAMQAATTPLSAIDIIGLFPGFGRPGLRY